ncbi:uncharacterized protein LOC109863849 isoform X2 [Pseudomyrmex gracilis]|uniref:uncharacterized protein LOC109863849 isoform X2 n=1 Tax=Pseudomyrmex gracilis TaxID=219809 RepID=UPI00099515BA|nr:uncharacterized protein LOC109863849 isoform X2 [Pseudomyrmex gracilis]
MIYENEELRLRTIHINAEVEQGQNDIKKLRRENEQLRREIWSLRDEYDKLEDILKRQKNGGESEEYEDRSEEDDEPQSDFSCEEGEEDEEEYEGNERTKDFNQEEQLENAENQKISSEKMSSSLHRLHVEFDDLSVVDEEEELKKEKEKKEATSSSSDGQKNDGGSAVRYPPPPIHGLRQLHDNIPFYPATYEPASGFSGTSYYTECPFPSTVDLMLPTLLASPCSGLQSDPLIPLAGLDDRPPNIGPDQVAADPMLPQIHVPPVEWQSNVTITQNEQMPSFYTSTKVAPVSSTTWMTGKSQSEYQTTIPLVENQAFSFPRRTNAITRQHSKLQEKSAIQDSLTYFSSSEEPVGRNAWDVIADFADRKKSIANDEKDTGERQSQNVEETAATVSEKPKHFFAPLPFKLKRQEEESPTTSHFGTGTSSSSGKTVSTVISRTNPFIGQKGSADIYVNGAIPCDDENRDNSKTFLSTNNLLISDGKGNQLIKSLSCQDLSSESQTAMPLKLNQVESQVLAKSDNTLDNITGGSRPYKSHLNVTLKIPRVEQAPSPETPEVPNLPSIDYRIFRNPFLRTFDKMNRGYQVKPNPPPPRATSPLSIQVNDDVYRYPMSTYSRGVHLNDRFRAAAHLADQNRLLMPSDQLMGGKQDIQMTSFEKPSPCTLIPPAAPYDLTTLRRLNRCTQNLYQNIPFAPRGIERSGQFYPQTGGIMYYDNTVMKVPAQTQTSIDGDSYHEDERHDEQTVNVPNSPNEQKRKKPVRRNKDQAPPVVQGRLKKQGSITSTDTPGSPGKITRKKPKRLSATDAQEDKNESRTSSSSGQESPRKDQTRRISYVNSKRRSSPTSLKTSRSGSVDATRDKVLTEGAALHSEREGTNSVSSREITGGKTRKTSTSSGNVPWCACWGNGCV